MIAVVGLGYVGLPLAVEFGRRFEVVGFDINSERVAELAAGHDRTLEVPDSELHASTVQFTDQVRALRPASVYVVTVPTPIDQHKRPDLRALIGASETVGSVLAPGDIVVYESTVYPGCTEEVCVPVLEAVSGLRLNEQFSVGYSPERINPGDRERKLTNITKVVSASNPSALDKLEVIYTTTIPAGTHRASSIRVAEAAKVIENTQRDVNIALMNDLSLLFGRLGLDTQEVLAAAGTKWNFLPFTPGLVGGHCIGVDPYYLTHKAQEVGHHSDVILAGRRINDYMGVYVADQLILEMSRRGIPIGGSRVAVMGLAFKENCPDLRNTRVVDITSRLGEYAVGVDVFDPWVDAAEAKQAYGLSVTADLPEGAQFDAAVIAVAHREFRGMGPALRSAVGDNGVIFDVKGIVGRFADLRL